jgi:hypothetical protein
MIYYSIVDELKISVGRLMLIDNSSVNNILASLKTENLGLIEVIKDLYSPMAKEAIIYIEQNLWLKKILLKNYENLNTEDFKDSYITDYSKIKTVKDYCNKFIEFNINDCYKILFKLNKHEENFKLLENKNHFNALSFDSISVFLKDELSNSINCIKSNELAINIENITFLTEPNFYNTLNVLSINIDTELTNISKKISSNFKAYNYNGKTFTENFFKAVVNYKSDVDFIFKTEKISPKKLAPEFKKKSQQKDTVFVITSLAVLFLISLFIS